jgi:hypothetical protein
MIKHVSPESQRMSNDSIHPPKVVILLHNLPRELNKSFGFSSKNDVKVEFEAILQTWKQLDEMAYLRRDARLKS